jgi:hypothetical protein
MLCSERRGEDHQRTPAAFDVLHRQAPHYGRTGRLRHKITLRHLLQLPTGVLLLTNISSDASGLPSGLPPLSTPVARRPPWTANPGEPPSFLTPQISPPRYSGPPSPLLTSPRCWHHLDNRAAASPAWSRAMGSELPYFAHGQPAHGCRLVGLGPTNVGPG